MTALHGRTKGFTLGELLIIFAVLFVIGALMLPVVRYTRTSLQRTTCANNLQHVGLAMYIYAREHNGKFPGSLETLYKEEYLADKKLMDCPVSGEIGTLESPDYIYTPGLSVRSSSLEVLLRDKPENHPSGGSNCLYVRGTVAPKKE